MNSVVVELLRRDAAAVECVATNDYNGNMGLRISALFVILVTSMFGAMFPIIAKNNPSLKIPSWAFFFARYFGSGIIVATAFIHLLSPSAQALGDPCLTGPITVYPWAQAIAMMSLFALFLVEILAMRYASFTSLSNAVKDELPGHYLSPQSISEKCDPAEAADGSDTEMAPAKFSELAEGEYVAQLTSLFILEFGVIFHSIFIGLTLAVSGSEFKTLYVVLVFHQTFEGLGLGARLSAVLWPKLGWKRFTPYLMAVAYSLSTPVAIAIGLGVRNTYAPGTATALVVNGVFDAISAGILLFTGLIELIAKDFLFNPKLIKEGNTVFLAFSWMVLGAGIMALLGRWA